MIVIINKKKILEETKKWLQQNGNQITLGQNKTIQDIATAASKASELLDANVNLHKVLLRLQGYFLTGILGPYILLLRTTADTIDDFVKDFKNIGFFILEVNPDGKYVLPEDADGNPIKILVGGVATYVALARILASAAAIGQTKSEFGAFKGQKSFLEKMISTLLGLKNQLMKYLWVNLEPESRRRENANDNTLAARDETTGLFKMTPSQVIATIIAAMDDKLDLRRPQLSKSAEAGAIVMIVGLSDLTKNLANLQSIIKAFLTFFGWRRKERQRRKSSCCWWNSNRNGKIGSPC